MGKMRFAMKIFVQCSTTSVPTCKSCLGRISGFLCRTRVLNGAEAQLQGWGEQRGWSVPRVHPSSQLCLGKQEGTRRKKKHKFRWCQGMDVVTANQGSHCHNCFGINHSLKGPRHHTSTGISPCPAFCCSLLWCWAHPEEWSDFLNGACHSASSSAWLNSFINYITNIIWIESKPGEFGLDWKAASHLTLLQCIHEFVSFRDDSFL